MGESEDGIDILTKVAIVNHEKTLLNSFVKTDIDVVDLRTEFRWVLYNLKCEYCCLMLALKWCES